MPPDESAPSSPARPTRRRSPGTGSLFIARDLAGRETYYGKWRVGSEQIKRRIGPKRNPATREGLTRTQAEAELRRLMSTLQQTSTLGGHTTVAEGGALLIESITTKGRKRATIQTYESHIHVHLAPFFGAQRAWTASAGARSRRSCVTWAGQGGPQRRRSTRSPCCTGSSSWLAARSGCGRTRARCRQAALDRGPQTSISSISRKSRRCCAPFPMTTSAASSARCTSRPR